MRQLIDTYLPDADTITTFDSEASVTQLFSGVNWSARLQLFYDGSANLVLFSKEFKSTTEVQFLRAETLKGWIQAIKDLQGMDWEPSNFNPWVNILANLRQEAMTLLNE